jgi:hypothetical protein
VAHGAHGAEHRRLLADAFGRVAAGAVDDEADRALDLGIEHVVGAEQAAARLLGVDDVDFVGSAELVAGGPERIGMGGAIGVALVLAVVELVIGHPRHRPMDDVELGGGGDAGKEDAGKERPKARVHLVGVGEAERVERVGDVGCADLPQDGQSVLADRHGAFLLIVCKGMKGKVAQALHAAN